MEHEIGSKRSLPRRQFSSQRKQHRPLYKCCFCIQRTAVRPFAGEGSFNHGRCRTQRHCHTARQATEGSRLRRNLAAFPLLNLTQYGRTFSLAFAVGRSQLRPGAGHLTTCGAGTIFTLAAGRVTGGGIVQETIIFNGTIIGEGQRVECEVRATKTTLDGDSPVFSNYRIMESDLTDSLPDGNYELLVNRERTRFSRDAGRFLSRPY